MNEDKAGRRLQQRFQKKDEQDYHNGLANLLSTKEGRRFVQIFTASLGVGESAFSDKRGRTDYNLGRQYAGQFLLDQIQENHLDAYVQLLKEKQDVQIERTAALATALQGTARRGDADAESDPYTDI